RDDQGFRHPWPCPHYATVLLPRQEDFVAGKNGPSCRERGRIFVLGTRNEENWRPDMRTDDLSVPTITAFERSPDGGKGQARDMRVRWAFEEVGQPYDVRPVSFAALKEPAHL